MKILFLTSGSVRSNFTYRVLSLAREMKKRDHSVSMISPKADKYNNFKAEKIDSIDGVKILQPFQFKTKRVEINLFPYIFNAIFLIAKEKPDLIYIYKPTPISVIGLLAKIFRRVQIILDMDDLGSEVMKIEGHPWHQKKLVEWSERLAARYSDRLVVASSYLLERYQKQFPKKPIHLMPNGADADWFSPIDSCGTRKQIVFMGSMNRRNILEPLFDVFPVVVKKHPDAKLLIMGDGKYLSYFKNKCQKFGIEKYVQFTGWLDIEKVRENLQAGDIGYNYMPDDPTVKAASNMKVSQYMARGVVPIVSNVGDLPAMVSFGKAGYICETNDSLDLEKKLLEAIEDKDRTISKANTARDIAVEKFSWSKLAADFDEWLSGKKSSEKSGKKKIYIVATNIPSDTGGAEIRNFNLIKQIVKKNDSEVSLFCIAKEEKATHLKKMESDLGIRIYAFQKQSGSIASNIRAMLNRMQPFLIEYMLSGLGEKFRSVCETERPDVVQIEQIDAYFCIRPHMSYLKSKGIKIILDAHNIEAEAFEGAIQTFSFFKKIVGKFLLSPLKRLEIEAAKKCNFIFACSNEDADYFKKYNKQVRIIPNGCDCEQFFPSSKNGEPSLIFIGGIKYPPNADALRFYLKDIHPEVKKVVPKIQLLAIGATKEWLRDNQIKDESVISLGFMDDVKPYIDKAILGICPIRQGSGTRLKVLTFMASGLPVVATSKGAEGILYTDKKNIIIADSAEQFAKSTIDLLNNQSLQKSIGDNARELILKYYDWNVIGRGIGVVYKEIIKR